MYAFLILCLSAATQSLCQNLQIVPHGVSNDGNALHPAIDIRQKMDLERKSYPTFEPSKRKSPFDSVAEQIYGGRDLGQRKSWAATEECDYLSDALENALRSNIMQLNLIFDKITELYMSSDGIERPTLTLLINFNEYLREFAHEFAIAYHSTEMTQKFADVEKDATLLVTIFSKRNPSGADYGGLLKAVDNELTQLNVNLDCYRTASRSVRSS